MPLLGPSEVIRGPRETRFGPDCPRLVRLGWTHAHHTLWPGIGPLLGPRGAKKGYFAPVPKFPRPNFVMEFFCFKYRLVGCPEHRSGIPCSSSTVIANLEPPSSRKRSKTGKKGLFGPQNTLLGALEVLGRPRGPVFCPTATGWSSWVSRIHTMCLGPFRDLYGTPGAPKRVRFRPETPFWGPRRSFGSPQWPDLGPTATSWSVWLSRIHIMCSGLFKDLYGTAGAPKGAPFWAKDPFWGPLAFSRRPRQPKWSPNKPNALHPSAACCMECYMCLQGYIEPPFQPQGPQKGNFALTS